MHSRRDFIRSAALLSGAAGLLGGLPASIRRALAIEPEAASTFHDAEHVVILMQENRSFDHCFGALRGVRGFNDPRAVTLDDGNPVWVQPGPGGEHFAPFRLDIHGTKATWMGSLPHSWTDQIDAANGGRHDGWLKAKRSGESAYAGMPLTLGHYTRADVPFYYSLADAFTICDQHFCSSLTGTTPNRLYLWTGAVREKPGADSPANVRNEDVDYGRWAKWTTFPERLEDLGISWRIYQNELSLESGLAGEEDAWLSNFTDNPIEWFEQFQVRFAASHRDFAGRRVREIPAEIEALKAQMAGRPAADPEAAKHRARIGELEAALARLRQEQAEFSAERFAELPARTRSLHERAFTTNRGDPHYRELVEHVYRDGQAERRVQVPRGDILHQFRADVAGGRLPTVSWIVPPERLSDHPGSAWYGAWCVSEILDILTSNPGVWKKTIFILTYDENDGYFDHVPPFAPPDPVKPGSGRVSASIDPGVEHVTLEQDLKSHPAEQARAGPIGLGFRVPMIIASPWNRGGRVCSQVFDHTSVLQFLETFLSRKTGKSVREANISAWRRAVCGDLTSAFLPEPDSRAAALPVLSRDGVVEDIHRAQFKGFPTGFRPLTPEELARVRRDPAGSGLLPAQEPGTRPSCPLPYDLMLDGAVLPPDPARAGPTFRFVFEARALKGRPSAGAPFTVYALGAKGGLQIRRYALAAGDAIEDFWPLADLGADQFHFRAYGPNGFFREFRASPTDPILAVACENRPAPTLSAPPAGHERGALAGDLLLSINSADPRPIRFEIRDNAYGAPPRSQTIHAGEPTSILVDPSSASGWYDFSLTVVDRPGLFYRFAGRVDTGAPTISDPAMAGPRA